MFILKTFEDKVSRMSISDNTYYFLYWYYISPPGKCTVEHDVPKWHNLFIVF